MAITQTFTQSVITGDTINNPTSLQFGADGRLYVSQQNGLIKVYDITKNGSTWEASNEEVIDLIQDIPNHDDDGDLNTGVNTRQVTGLRVEGTAENPILYVTSSDPRIGAGGGGNDVGLDTNSGIISRLTWNGTSWDKVDLVIGLPRSEENHSTNGLDIRTESVEVSPGVFEDREIMYVMSGGFDNKGAPSNNFAYTPEYYYSGAMLRVDLTQLAEIEATEGTKGGTAYVDEYVYALPTLDDPTRANETAVTGDGAVDSAAGTTGAADLEAGDTFGGNDGRNQAKFDPGGPVQVYSPGYRNAYDVVITEDGNIYTFDNGPNNGWGGAPVDDTGSAEVTSETQVATNQPNLSDNTNDSDPDNLHIVEDGTYGGHPNPTRASGEAAGLWSGEGGGLSPDVQLTPVGDPANDPNTVWDDLPEDWDTITGGNTNPIEGVYYGPDNNPGPKDESLYSINSSSNGLTEYTATGIGDGGAGTEYLAVASFNGNVTLIEVQTDGTAAGSSVTATQSIQVSGTPLDLTALGNGGIPGSGGVGAGAIFVAQYGQDNLVVLEPGTPPGPDLDADNDGVLDQNDPLQYDPDNGTQTVLNGGETLFWDFNPAAGTHPGPSGDYNIGMNGWMIDGSGEVNPDVLTENPGEDLLTDLNNTIRGGAPGVVQIKQVTDGDNYQGNNTQNDALQTGFTPAADVGTFTIRVPIFNPFSSVGLDQNFGSVGFSLGDGTQSNFLKVVAGIGGNAPRLQVYYEENDGGVVDISVNGTADPDFNDAATNATGNAILNLYLEVDLLTPGAATAQAYYNYELSPGGGMVLAEPKAIGGPIALQGNVLDAVLGNATIQDEAGNDLPSSAVVTLLATSFGAETPFEANFVDLEITSTAQEVAPVAGDDTVETAPDQAIDIPVADLLANDSDANAGDTLTISSVQNAQNGTAVLNDNGTAGDGSDDFVTFTPDAGFEGEATFDYTLDDGTGRSDTGTVSVQVADDQVLYRVNAGGGEIAATDGGPNWAANTGTGAQSGDGFANNTGNTTTPSAVTAATGQFALPSYAPLALFDSERWDPGAAPEMEYTFEVTTPGTYTVNLFMADGYSGTAAAGDRVFDISIEGVLVEDDLDMIATVGDQTAALFSYEVAVTDGILNILWEHVTENPTINAIEIIGPPQDPLLDTQAPVVASIDVAPLSTQPGNDQPVIVTVTFTDNIGIDTDSILGTTLSVTGGPVGTDATIVGITSGADGDPTVIAEYIVDAPDGGWPALTPYTFEVTGVADEAGNTVVATSAGYTFLNPVQPGDAIYRVNVGGPELAAADGSSLAWSADTGNFGTAGNSPYLVSNSTGGSTYSTSAGSAVPVTAFATNIADSAPDALFDTERYDVANAPEMAWAFPVAGPGDYVVNLFFAEIFSGITAADQRQFDVSVEGTVPAVFDNIDPYETAGPGGAYMLSHTVTVTDGVLDLTFLHDIENPALKGIEILVAGEAEPIDSFNGTPALGGDFSNDNSNPDDVTLTLGTNTLVSNGELSDSDFITFTVAPGQQLTQLNLVGFDNEASNATFLGIQIGDTMPSQADIQNSAATLDGGTVYDESQVGTDLLPLLASTTVENAGQATNGLTLPLGEGTYTLWFNQNQALTTTTIELVTEEVVSQTGAAVLEVTVDADNVQSSNFGNNSFVLTNVGDKDITKLEIDVTNAIFTDAVFDPFGVAGDTIAKLLTINTNGNTGVDAPDHGTNAAPGTTYIGVGGIAGFEGVQLTFNPGTNGGFNPGESVGFAVDMDPNSIAGATKSTLDSGASPAWDIGGISGAELIGSTFTVTFADGSTATGTLSGAGNQAGSKGLASQSSPNLTPTLTINGLEPGDVGTYVDGGPSIIVDGPAGETVRVVVAKGIIQPVTNNFPDDPGNPNDYHDQLDDQLAALAAADFPANNAAEFLTVDVVLTGSPQDISGLFDFSQVAEGQPLAVDEGKLPLGIVAAIIDPANDDLPKGAVTDAVYLTHTVNAAPVAQDDGFAIDEGGTIIGGNVLADNGNGADDDIDGVTLTVTAVNGVAGDVGTQVTLPSGALLTLNQDGTFDYDPNGLDVPAGETAEDTFTYQITDSEGATDTATVTVTISGVTNPDDIDDDGILNTDDPFAYDGSNGLDKALVPGGEFLQDFNTDTADPFSPEAGFSGIIVNQDYDPAGASEADPYGDRTTESGVSVANGVLTVTSSDTDLYNTGTPGNQSNQVKDNYQSAADVTGVDEFEVVAKVANPFAGGIPQQYASFGITLGAGGTDDYIKFVYGGSGSQPRIQLAQESSLTGAKEENITLASQGIVEEDVADIEFRLYVDQVAGTVQGTATLLDSSGGVIGTISTAVRGIDPAGSLAAALAGENPLTGGEGGIAYGISITDWSGAPEFSADWDFLRLTALDEVIATLSVDDPTVVEAGDTGQTTLAFTISSDVAINGDVDVGFTLTGLLTGLPVSPATLTFVDGVATLEVTVGNDDLANGDDLVGIELTSVTPSAGSAITATLQLGDTLGTGTVTEDDAAPVAVDDTVAASPDQALTIALGDLVGNDSDADNVPADLTILSVGTDGSDNATANGGTVQVEVNGDVTYTPAAGFTGQDTFTYVVTDPAGNLGTATVTVEVSEAVIDATIEVSGSTTFGTNAFNIALGPNASEGLQIKSIEFDLGTATMSYGLDLTGGTFLGAVWDPTGDAGDEGAQGLKFNDNVVGLTDAFGNVLLPITADPGYGGDIGAYPFTVQLDGPNGPGGFRYMTLNFDNFDVGESFDFGIDVDPQSIQGASGTGQAGAVSGGEIAGTTITVTFEDATGNTIVQTRQLELTGLNTSAARFTSDAVQAAPVLEVVGVTGTERRVETDSTTHTVEVSGVAPGDTVELYLVDASGYEKAGGNGTATLSSDPFHGNDMDTAPTILSAVANAAGIATFTVTLNAAENAPAPATMDGLFFLSAGVVDGSGTLVSALSEAAELKLLPPEPDAIYKLEGDVDITGTGSVINLAPSSAFEVPAATIAMFFEADSVNGTFGLFAKDANGYAGGDHLRARIEDGDLVVRFQTAEGGDIDLIVPGINAGQTYHLAVSFGPNGAQVYLDGALVASDSGFDMDWLDNGQWLQFGGDGSSSANGGSSFGNPFDGTLSDICVLDGQLSASQVAALANGTPPPVNEAPVITSADAFEFVQDSDGPVFTATATDADNDEVTFSLAGDDAGLFAIDAATGEVTLVNEPTFPTLEVNSLEDVIQTLSIQVIASDGTAQTTQSVTVDYLTDRDGDTIADIEDNAIFVFNTDQADSNNDGYGDVLAPDINGDNIVNLLDFSILSAAFNTAQGNPNYDERADLNYDGQISALDFSALAAQFNTDLPQLSYVDLFQN